MAARCSSEATHRPRSCPRFSRSPTTRSGTSRPFPSSAATPLSSRCTPPFARTLEEFVAHVRANPGRLNYGSAGTGTLTQIAAALWVHRLGLDIVHVPFRGGAQSVTEALAGRVQMLTGVTGGMLPAAANGGSRILAVSGAERLPQIPDVPTLAESLPGFVVINWNGVVVHAGTPRPILNRLFEAVMAVMREPAVRERLATLGVTPVGNTPEEMAAHMQQEAPLFRAAARIPGMRDT
ncbi:Bug family tripartite tricarboxylate transporter substrate binding protein [Muricoccus radiodurans]|uniref:Bug family tripartite tricarboxylate transporter substrate binding protein n=1 Tax=Muricoccus radiodurans TaxID=2231721 RepID=UPI003CEF5E2B